tara:strand:+ start:5623 stop:6231 length:609 start_codon:yes stop_codon:yes gene_type:complete
VYTTIDTENSCIRGLPTPTHPPPSYVIQSLEQNDPEGGDTVKWTSTLRVIRIGSYWSVEAKSPEGDVYVADIGTDDYISIRYSDTNSEPHRTDGPAIVIYKKGRIRYAEYYTHGELHREDGPAYIEYHPDGSYKRREWRIDGRYHNTERPAVVTNSTPDRGSEQRYYYLNNHPYHYSVWCILRWWYKRRGATSRSNVEEQRP